LSGEHVDAIARHTDALDDNQRTGLDLGAVLARGEQLPPESFNRYLKQLVDGLRGDQGLGDAIAKQQAAEFRHWFDHATGMGRFSGSLDPERYEELTTTIEQRCGSLAAAGDVEKGPNLAATALVDLVSGAAAGANARERLPSILVVVDHCSVPGGSQTGPTYQTGNGHNLAAASVDRLTCDATIRRVTLDDSGVPINVGRKHRTATDAQWAALKAIHSTCGWVDCAAPINWCQAHHIHEWEHGGHTNLDNLIPLCSRHHHRVHEGKWSVKLKPDRSLVIFRPDGVLYATAPTPSRASPVGCAT
jgi:5-methylcytosine-specific restriction endonuclease McrA